MMLTGPTMELFVERFIGRRKRSKPFSLQEGSCSLHHLLAVTRGTLSLVYALHCASLLLGVSQFPSFLLTAL